MVLPLITSVSREVILTTPTAQREALLALGATRWEVIRHAVLPFARIGITGGVILALGRALGETMAVTMVIGNQASPIGPSLFNTGYTLSSVIANQFGEATPGLFFSAVIEAGLLVFIITLIANILARHPDLPDGPPCGRTCRMSTVLEKPQVANPFQAPRTAHNARRRAANLAIVVLSLLATAFAVAVLLYSAALRAAPGASLHQPGSVHQDPHAQWRAGRRHRPGHPGIADHGRPGLAHRHPAGSVRGHLPLRVRGAWGHSPWACASWSTC